MLGTLHQVAMQCFGCIFHCLHFAVGFVCGQLLFPLFALLGDVGCLQVVVDDAYCFVAHLYVCHHAAIAAVRVGNVLGIGDGVSAEDGYRQFALCLFLVWHVKIGPFGQGLFDVVHRKFLVVAEFLEAEHIRLLLAHVLGNLATRIAAYLVAKAVYIVGGNGQ